MPSYEFECHKCGHTFEIFRKVDERDDPLPCPECRSAKVERKLSTFVALVPQGGSGCTPEKAATCGNAGFG